MIDVITDTLLDALKLLPFLFITYLIMEYIESKAGDSFNEAVSRAGVLGPLFGGVLGAFPQCGFSAAASNLYAGRVITLGTLLSIFLSTSDEMLPIFVSEQMNVSSIVKILAIKALMGAFWGFFVDFVLKLMHKKKADIDIERLCKKEHCHCEDEEGILKPALVHTGHIFLFLIIVTFCINIAVFFIGEDTIKLLAVGVPFLGAVVSGLIGLIPNCAASVVLTELYLEGILSFGALMSGLMVAAGVGLLVLFRVNDNKKENVRITLILYGIGVISGIIIEAAGVVV
ncbi:MAG: arsenic efflux protein [Lachnospiraceae bacterium]|nr:arsenic efflux protein [Lachnospiraceae bacterium]